MSKILISFLKITYIRERNMVEFRYSECSENGNHKLIALFLLKIKLVILMSNSHKNVSIINEIVLKNKISPFLRKLDLERKF